MSAKGRRSVRLHPSTIALPTPPDRIQHTTTPRSRSNVNKTPRRSAAAETEEEGNDGATAAAALDANIGAASSQLEVRVDDAVVGMMLYPRSLYPTFCPNTAPPPSL